ncbi:alpha/beta hydrolase [Planosporangium sp. 12N6]|uniref:alpha/beta hydrolase n=1 Tax=Planosporangium spinosum TaxID=3402278 RepID=UPI003CF66326
MTRRPSTARCVARLPARPGSRRAPTIRRGLGTALSALPAAGTLLLLGVLWTAARAGRFDGVPLLGPALAPAVEVLGVLALAGSWLSRRRRWLRRYLPAVVLTATAMTGVAATALRLTGMVTDPYPPSFALWAGLGLAALVGFPLVVTGPDRRRRWAAGAAVPLTLAGALLLVNDEYGVWPTVGDLLGHTRVRGASALHLPPGSVRSDSGVLVALDPPATRSRFAHRRGSVYLPPAYFTPARTKLPVVVMLAGAPGAPVQWPTSGRAIASADAYAAGHHGRAPVLLFVDQNGSATGDTECVDGPRGDAETYLTVDVPAFVTRTLRIPRFPGRWAVAGFSAGGTCALDLALAHPDTFRTFVDLAGDPRPNLGDAAHTRRVLFGGSRHAMTDHDPVRLLRTRHGRGLTGWFASGADDGVRLAVSKRLAATAARNGVRVHAFTGVAGHNWQFASDAFARLLPPLCADLGLR